MSTVFRVTDMGNMDIAGACRGLFVWAAHCSGACMVCHSVRSMPPPRQVSLTCRNIAFKDSSYNY